MPARVAYYLRCLDRRFPSQKLQDDDQLNCAISEKSRQFLTQRPKEQKIREASIVDSTASIEIIAKCQTH
jgi:hypothetical protein